jgi:dihydrofolate reductase
MRHLRRRISSELLARVPVFILASHCIAGRFLASRSSSSSTLYVEALSNPHQPVMAPPQAIEDGNKNRLIGCVNIGLSVDGFIADKGGGIDWLNEQPQIEGEDFGFGDFLKSMNLMIMGRNTFDVVVGFGKESWAYGDLPILVYTRNVDSVTIPEWVPKTVSARSAASPQALWKELEEAGECGRVYVDGGRTIQDFLQAGLIHRMALSRIPILLGEGIPLFSGNDPTRRQLKHVSTKAYSNGTVTTIYDVVDKANEVKTIRSGET